ncbi:type VI secretion system contractile sheath protein TssC [Chitinophaga sp. CB10]|uniref:type VI secretion system contractile sheath protein TssC n=1 Tax=Chitinophaga sp. CB10 TaxID=1891659 RepID=UPI000A8880A0|nr:type VI secretion system contractile sheath protein TssC [Chitinophaga sp. CB10]
MLTTEVQLVQPLQALGSFGGFELLESAIEGTQNLNPDRKARRQLFLTEASKESDRLRLKKLLQIWAGLLRSHEGIATMQAACNEAILESETLLKENLLLALEESKELERSYRNVALFFSNTTQDKIKNVSFLNAAPEQLRDADNTRFLDAVKAELQQHYDRLDLRDNYSLLIIPGYAGSNMILERWARIAYDNKCMLLTDFCQLDAPDDVMEVFEMAQLTGADAYRSNVIMTCNWLIGRVKADLVGEASHLFVPASGALAGRIYQTIMSQVTAGKKFGSLIDVEGVNFPLKKSEIASLEKLGLVPIVQEYGKVMAFSARTLFNGENLGLQTYSVVRVFDYVTKVLIDFLNRRAFENFSANTRKDLQRQIIQFLDGITGPERLIEDFEIRRFEQDTRDKDTIHLDIFLKPYFPARNFLIRMDGHKGEQNNEWETNYEQTH